MLDELERLLNVTAQRSWYTEQYRDDDYEIYERGKNIDLRIATVNDAKRAALIAALRNTAPALIAIARAALAEREAGQNENADVALPALIAAWERMQEALEAWDALERETQG